MHTLSRVFVLTGLVSNLLAVHGRENGHVATENCKNALQTETDCDLNSSKCICNYLDNYDLSHWTRELCDEADISIKTLYKDICTDHPFLFPHRTSAPMVRVGDSSSSDDTNSNSPQAQEEETEDEDDNDNDNDASNFSDKMSSLVAFPSASPAPSSSFPVASAVAVAQAAGVVGGGGRVRHPPNNNIHNRGIQLEQQQQQAQKPYTDASGMIHMPIVYKTVTTTHTHTECLCDTGPGSASASAAASSEPGETSNPEADAEKVSNSGSNAETTPTETSHAAMESSSSSSVNAPVPPAPAPVPVAPTSTMLIGSLASTPSSSAVVGSSSHGVLGTSAAEATPTTAVVSESDLDSETLAEAIPTGVDPQRSGAGEVEEDGSRTTHAYENSAAKAVSGGVGLVVAGIAGLMAVVML